MTKNNWRIYLNGRGYRHCRPFLDWIRENVSLRTDKKGNEYIFVSDLLKHKGQLIGTNLHNKTRLNWMSWFKNEVVAFDEVNNFIAGLNLPAEIMEKTKVYGVACTLDSNFKKEELKTFFKTVGLEEWID